MHMVEFVLGMLVLGAGVGLISNGLGLGGGILMVPAFLTFFTPMADLPHTAKGTSLFIIIFVAAYNAWRLNHGHKDKMLGLATVLASGSIVGAYLGGWFTQPQYIARDTLLWIFAGFVTLMATRTFLLKTPRVTEEQVRRRWALAVAIGALAGLASGATGIGGGGVLVPLALMAGLVTNERVVALSNTVMVVTCIAAVAAHVTAEPQMDFPGTIGHVNVALAPFVFAGALAAAPLGRRINDLLTLKKRRLVLGAVLLIIAVRLGYQAWQLG